MISKLRASVFALGTLTACVEADEVIQSDDVELVEVEQSLTGVGTYTWGSTTSGTSSAEIGSTTNRACFIAGIGGSLTTWAHPAGQDNAQAGVRINANNKWEIFVRPAIDGGRLRVWATCMQSTTLTSEVFWSNLGPGGKVNIAPVVPGRRCFFTKLGTGRGNTFAHGGYQSGLDQVRIGNDGVNWYIDGSAQGQVSAYARCITVAQDLGAFLTYANPGSHNDSPMVTANSDTACLITQIGGTIKNGDATDNGLRVKLDSVNPTWLFHAKDGAGGWARCVK